MAANDQGPNWGKFLTSGFEIAAGTALGSFSGVWVDRKLGSSPWGLLIGLLLGCAGGTYLLIKETMKMNKD
jgi:F0F1-type ATP synthase assembly protein I